jgi:hypothetical protein
MSEEIVLPCADKLAFDTLKEAKGVAVTSEYRYGSKLKVYQCRYCHQYHLATNYDD